ncbi:hypothetical protein RHOSPDRAFT_24956, partial [Rhodotorula sp. JG-1b]
LDISLYLRGPPPARISRSKTWFCQLHTSHLQLASYSMLLQTQIAGTPGKGLQGDWDQLLGLMTSLQLSRYSVPSDLRAPPDLSRLWEVKDRKIEDLSKSEITIVQYGHAGKEQPAAD